MVWKKSLNGLILVLLASCVLKLQWNSTNSPPNQLQFTIDFSCQNTRSNTRIFKWERSHFVSYVHRSCPTCTWNYSISSMLNVILVWFIFFSWCVITHLRFRGYADRHRNVKIARHWTKPWRHVMPIKAGLVSYKHNNVAPFVGSRCNKFEHDLCPGPSKSVLSKFLTCYLNITFQSRCRHKQGVNKNTREKQLHSLADTDCWPIGAIISFCFKNSVKLRESKNCTL